LAAIEDAHLVISRNADVGVAVKDLDALVRFRTVPDHVAEQPDPVEPSTTTPILQHGMKSPQIRVHISQQQNSTHHGHYTTVPRDL
jgi:hypothetical protein